MGIVTDRLTDMLNSQKERGLVIWFDPEQNYMEYVRQRPDIIQYTGSFFELRHRLEPLLEWDLQTPLRTPKGILYIPMSEADTQAALCELTAIGIIMKPGYHHQAQNTRLAVIARAALRSMRNSEQLAEIYYKVEQKEFSLADLDALAAQSMITGTESISLVFGAHDPAHVALSFLSNPKLDQKIKEKAFGDLKQLLRSEYDYPIAATADVEELRAAFAEHVLRTDLITTIGVDRLPPELQNVQIPWENEYAHVACQQLAAQWRGKIQDRDHYIQVANAVEKHLSLDRIKIPLTETTPCETCLIIEQTLQNILAQKIAEDAQEELLNIVRTRKEKGFWPSVNDTMETRWQLLSYAGQLIIIARSIELALKKQLTAGDIAQMYTKGDGRDVPWCEIDTMHRKLTKAYHKGNTTARDTAIHGLVTETQQRYTGVIDELIRRFMQALERSNFQSPVALRQRDIFYRIVEPAVRSGKTAYLFVDALRYEMAKELSNNLETNPTISNIRLEAAFGSAPSITPVGMASLLPGAEQETTQLDSEKNTIGVRIQGEFLSSRADRMKWLATHLPALSDNRQTKMYETTLDNLSTQDDAKKNLSEADFAVITSQEIDALGESGQAQIAREAMDLMLEYLQSAIVFLAQAGYQNIIITADHGYLFGQDVPDSMKISPPAGGQKIDLHQRAWVGVGGTGHESVVRTPLSAFGLHPQWDIVFPLGIGIFKVSGGNKAYFHGGISPQEILIPILQVSTHKEPETEDDAFQWFLRLRSDKIQTRIFSVVIEGQRLHMFATLPKVYVEIRAGRETLSSRSDGQSGPITLETNNQWEIVPYKVILTIITETKPAKQIALHLIDAGTGRDLIPPQELQWDIAW